MKLTHTLVSTLVFVTAACSASEVVVNERDLLRLRNGHNQKRTHSTAVNERRAFGGFGKFGGGNQGGNTGGNTGGKTATTGTNTNTNTGGNNANNGQTTTTTTVAAQGGAAGTTTTAAAAAATTTTAATGQANSGSSSGTAGGDPQTSLTIDPSQVVTALAQDGQQVPAAGQVASATSTNNFINFCLTRTDLPLTAGQQVTGGSCNAVPMGVIASQKVMPSAQFVVPANGQTLQANTNFTVQMNINNMETGNFVNADTNYFSAPANTNSQGQIIGHSHVVIQALDTANPTKPLDPTVFAFFKGLNDPAVNGQLSTVVAGGLPAGSYKISSINTSGNHAPVLVSVAQHGSLDDVAFFTVTDNGQAATGGNTGAATGATGATGNTGNTGNTGGNTGNTGGNTGTTTTAAAAAGTTTTAGNAAAAQTTTTAAAAATTTAAGSTTGKTGTTGNTGGNTNGQGGNFGGFGGKFGQGGRGAFVVSSSAAVDAVSATTAAASACTVASSAVVSSAVVAIASSAVASSSVLASSSAVAAVASSSAVVAAVSSSAVTATASSSTSSNKGQGQSQGGHSSGSKHGNNKRQDLTPGAKLLTKRLAALLAELEE